MWTDEEVDALLAEKARLREQVHELMARGADRVDAMNAEYGCPDCGVHHACGEVVAERERLRDELAVFRDQALPEAATIMNGLSAALAAVTADRERLTEQVTTLSIQGMGVETEYHDACAERDRLRAVVEASDGPVAKTMEYLGRVEAERDRLRAVVDGLRGYLSLQDVGEESPEVTGVFADIRAIIAGGASSELFADTSEPSHLVSDAEVGGEESVGASLSGPARPVQAARGSTHAVGSEGIERETPEGQHALEVRSDDET